MRIDIGQLEFIDKTLRDIVLWLENETGLEFTDTSLYRIDDPGVHGTLPLRGIDLRMRSRLVGRVIEALINNNWIYDPNRPELICCLLHGEDYNMHLHIQSHLNTRRI